jgi:hypothetical protein
MDKVAVRFRHPGRDQAYPLTAAKTLLSGFLRGLAAGRFSPTGRMPWPSRFFFPLPVRTPPSSLVLARAMTVVTAMTVPRISAGATIQWLHNRCSRL